LYLKDPSEELPVEEDRSEVDEEVELSESETFVLTGSSPAELDV
jgi:hypothetical protein